MSQSLKPPPRARDCGREGGAQRGCDVDLGLHSSSVCSRAVLFSVVTAGHMWLVEFQFLEIK